MNQIIRNSIQCWVINKIVQVNEGNRQATGNLSQCECIICCAQCKTANRKGKDFWV